MTIVTRPTSVQSLLGGSIELPIRACGHEPAMQVAPWTPKFIRSRKFVASLAWLSLWLKAGAKS